MKKLSPVLTNTLEAIRKHGEMLLNEEGEFVSVNARVGQPFKRVQQLEQLGLVRIDRVGSSTFVVVK